MSRGLMQRLGGSPAVARSTRSEQVAVLEHLRALLNTRWGNSEAAPEFGIPDFTDCLHNVPNALLHLQSTLQQTITRYEPRLSHVVVRAVEVDPASLILYFEVSAKLASGGEKLPMRFVTRVVRGGRVLVE